MWDDDEAGQYAVGRQLRQAGYDIIGARNGQSALALAESRQPDLDRSTCVCPMFVSTLAGTGENRRAR